MLSSRVITATLGDLSVTMSVIKECPQGGVLSPLLWSPVVDALPNKLSQLGYEVIGYADDIVLIVRGKDDATLSSRMQAALNATLLGCLQEGLSINLLKKVQILFSRRRKISITPPTLNEVRLGFSNEVKYLGIILDKKLNWST